MDSINITRFNELSLKQKELISLLIGAIASSSWNDKTENDNIKILKKTYEEVHDNCRKNMK